MRTHSVKIIVNPNADLGRAWRQASDLRPLADQFGGADWAGTVYPGHTIDLAEQAALEGYRMVIAAGGDGTVHEVVNGLMRVSEEQRPVLGVVPLGSGNDFAHNLGMSSDASVALKQVMTGKPRSIDVMRVCDDLGRCEYVDNTLGIGFDGLVNIRSRNFSWLRGFVMYLVAVLQTIVLDHNPPRMRFRSDAEQWEQQVLMLTLCNGPREGGGFLVAPDARPDDGVLDYACIGPVSRLMMLRLVPEVMRGTHIHMPQVQMGRLRNMTLEADGPLYMHADGEVFAGLGSDIRTLEVDVLPGVLQVIAPPDSPDA